MATSTRKRPAQGYPEGVYESYGKLYRDITITAEDGSQRVQQRRVARTLEKAKENRWDYYHPEFGWILEGYKLAKDRSIASRIGDTSVPEAPFDEDGNPITDDEKEEESD